LAPTPRRNRYGKNCSDATEAGITVVANNECPDSPVRTRTAPAKTSLAPMPAVIPPPKFRHVGAAAEMWRNGHRVCGRAGLDRRRKMRPSKRRGNSTSMPWAEAGPSARRTRPVRRRCKAAVDRNTRRGCGDTTGSPAGYRRGAGRSRWPVRAPARQAGGCGSTGARPGGRLLRPRRADQLGTCAKWCPTPRRRRRPETRRSREKR